MERKEARERSQRREEKDGGLFVVSSRVKSLLFASRRG